MYMITCVVQAFLCFTIYSLTDAKVMYVIWIVLSFVGEAAHFVLFGLCYVNFTLSTITNLVAEPILSFSF
jgi:hypothetical protein